MQIFLNLFPLYSLFTYIHCNFVCIMEIHTDTHCDFNCLAFEGRNTKQGCLNEILFKKYNSINICNNTEWSI